MPKVSSRVSLARNFQRHNPLESDLNSSSSKSRKPKRQKKSNDERENFVDSKASKRILRMGQELEDEERQERSSHLKSVFDFESRIEDDFYDDDDDDDDIERNYEEWRLDDQDDPQETEVSDLEVFNKFLPEQQESLSRLGPEVHQDNVNLNFDGTGTNLAHLILDKIAAHEASQNSNKRQKSKNGKYDDEYQIPEKVVDVYTKIGHILSRYKSGKLPKPFKILPTISRWEEIVEITRPESWTPNACYEATRIFVSNSQETAQRFINKIILPRVRDDIHETKKLNIHLYKSLKKGLYKPAAWFKGFLFPLVASGSCTLREAHIISSILVRVSIPVLHSAAAIKGLCDIAAQESYVENEGGGATNIFIKALLEKKYALPYQVIDALVFHFLRFRNTSSTSMILDVTENDNDNHSESGIKEIRLPVIWHQCLLKFAQRYRNDITEDQREALLDLLLVRGHYQISPAVRRELLQGRERGVAAKIQVDKFDGDDTLMSD